MATPYMAHHRRVSLGKIAAISIFAMFAVANGAPVAARSLNPQIDETAHEAAIVVSVNQHRHEAETSGGTSKPDAMSMADYRSASTETQVHALDRDRHANETALTSQAVIAVDDHWSLAELRGNTSWLRSLLLPNYRSIRADGSAWDKKVLLEHALKNRGHGSEKLKAFNAWLRTHPMTESVIIHGNVAILAFSDPKTGHVRLSNVFIHEKGRWLALYSQLTNIK